jgi:hypothetical protein
MPSWTPLSTPTAFPIDTMLLLTDGSVLAHEYSTPNWHKLVPDPNGDYSNGSWQSVAPMPANAPVNQQGPANAPLYFASAVLKDGRVFVAGGEYNNNQNVDLLAVEMYDPMANSWTSLPNPPGWTNIGDAPTCVFPDGRVLLGNINAVTTAIYDPVLNSWSSGGNKHDPSSEESWTLLPNNTVLVPEVTNHPQCEKYVISSGEWINETSIPIAADLVINVPGVSIEIGPAILMANGKVFGIGASGHTAIYTPGSTAMIPGTWVPGPNFPSDNNGNLMRAFDAPAVLLPSGNVLCVAGPVITSGGDQGWAGLPTNFFEFDGTNLNPVIGAPGAAGLLTFNCRFLLLPTGGVLFSTCSNNLSIYQPDGTPSASWKPTVTGCPGNLTRGTTYTVNGTQLNGLSQAVAYGDDAQMATNYPLVRIRNLASSDITYCRTHDHSTMAVATGATPQSTRFDVPNAIEAGASQLVVVANGIASDPWNVTIGP